MIKSTKSSLNFTFRKFLEHSALREQTLPSCLSYMYRTISFSAFETGAPRLCGLDRFFNWGPILFILWLWVACFRRFMSFLILAIFFILAWRPHSSFLCRETWWVNPLLVAKSCSQLSHFLKSKMWFHAWRLHMQA